MSDIQILTPTTKDEIEFYISNDGTQCGVSISGLARLCGVKRQSLSELVTYLSENDPAGKPIQELLKPLQGNVFTPASMGVNNAKIVSSKAASKIIQFYAYESKAKNETALKSLNAFLDIGVETWIKKVVGFVEPVVSTIDLYKEEWKRQALQELLGEVKEIKEIVDEVRGFRKSTVTLPGLVMQYEDYANLGKLEDISENPPFNLNQWLTARGIKLERGYACVFGRMVAEIYKVNRQQDPEKRSNKALGFKRNGSSTVYRSEDIPMIEAALVKLLKETGKGVAIKTSVEMLEADLSL